MSVMTLEGVVEDGQIRLMPQIKLPDGTRVYIIVPDIQISNVSRIYSPRLVNRADAADFVLEVIEEASDAGL
jgi:hypothetical protein